MAATQSQFVMQIKAHVAAAPAKCATLAVLALALVIIVAVQVVHDPASTEAAVLTTADEIPTPIVLSGVGVPEPGDEPETLNPLPPNVPELLSRDLFAIAGFPSPTEDAGEDQSEQSADDTGEEKRTLTLNATYLHEDQAEQHLAVINGMLLHANDRFGPYVVETIEPRQVVLRDGGSLIVLTMN